ncbi:MAG: hypothetical protein ACE5MG_03685, partial [Candidatus Methylomirabilales bacterium]
RTLVFKDLCVCSVDEFSHYILLFKRGVERSLVRPRQTAKGFATRHRKRYQGPVARVKENMV